MSVRFFITLLIFCNILNCKSQDVPHPIKLFDTLKNEVDISSEELIVYSDYLKLKPLERLDYFSKTYSEISAMLIIVYEVDILTLSNLPALPGFKEALLEEPFQFVVANDSEAFKNAINVLRDSLLTKHYLSDSKKEPQFSFYESPRDVGDLFSIYFENLPKNRIAFLEKFQKDLPLQLLLLIQTDLDHVFEVWTPNFIQEGKINEILFDAAVTIWKRKCN